MQGVGLYLWFVNRKRLTMPTTYGLMVHALRQGLTENEQMTIPTLLLILVDAGAWLRVLYLLVAR